MYSRIITIAYFVEDEYSDRGTHIQERNSLPVFSAKLFAILGEINLLCHFRWVKQLIKSRPLVKQLTDVLQVEFASVLTRNTCV